MPKARAKTKSKGARRTVGGHHREWLSLIEASGPFLSPSVLQKTFPQGLEEHDSEKSSALRVAWEEWMQATKNGEPDLEIHEQWVRFVLHEVLEFPDERLLEPKLWGDRLSVRLDQFQETLMPHQVIGEPANGSGPTPRVLIRVEKPDVDLEKAVSGTKWANASPITRMTELVRARRKDGVRLGLVTNGERWTLIHVPEEGNTGIASWWTWLWVDEPVTLRSFRSLLGVRRLFGVPDDETLEALWAQSVDQQAEVTTELGIQVRRALELLVRSIDRVDRDRNGELLEGVQDREVYRAAVSVMMRLVFLLYAEEHELLPLNDPVWNENYAITPIQATLREAADLQGEEVLERRHAAWNRLIATFRAVHGGVEHDRLTLPAYGGGLFDPDRYPLLEGRPAGSKWLDVASAPLPIDDRTVLEVLESLQFLGRRLSQGREERQRVSFRALGVEQIGHVYESLLDHTALRAKGPVLSLQGAKDREPEIEVTQLEELNAGGRSGLVNLLKKATGRSVKALEKALDEPEPAEGPVWSAACGGASDLLRSVAPWTALVRRDLDGTPVVIPSGSLYVTQGSDRRSTGTHYTPRSLTEPVVRYTLEPLVYEGPAEGKPAEEWQLRSPEQLLELKICDLAMGSGAFLVQVCRYLGDRLVEAWGAVEEANPGKVVVTPEGDVSSGALDEALVPLDDEDRALVARRFVADRCIYGVDKDPMAVDMAKLSMWLVTLQKNKPFTFVDHSLREGDALLGVARIPQMATCDLGGAAESIFSEEVRRLVGEAVARRLRLLKISDNEIRQVEEKARILRQSRDVVDELRVVADLIVEQAMQGMSSEEVAVHLASHVSDVLGAPAGSEMRQSGLQVLQSRTQSLRRARGANSDTVSGYLHWLLEFPEIFAPPASKCGDGAGFDAFVGNPPFLGGSRITGVLGSSYRDCVVRQYTPGARGKVDLCGYFLLRAAELGAPVSCIGLLGTTNISKGDTREVVLVPLLRTGSIYRAVSALPWPGSATVIVAIVHYFSGTWKGSRWLGDRAVDRIDSLLSASGAGVEEKPDKLSENKGRAFRGAEIRGTGFILDAAEAESLLEADPRNADVVLPYLSGEDLNTSPTFSPSRYVIDFQDWPRSRAEEYRACFDIVLERVKPYRDDLLERAQQVHEFDFWKFWDRRAAKFRQARKLDRVIATPWVSKYNSFAFVPPQMVISTMVTVILSESPGLLAVLESCAHDVWVWTFTTTLGGGRRYVPSRCFDSFPLPSDEACCGLRDLARGFLDERQARMRSASLGVTEVYNRMHQGEKEMAGLREMKEALDLSVTEVYGWGDLKLNHGYHTTSHGVRFSISDDAARAMLKRLLDLNREASKHSAKRSTNGIRTKREGGSPNWPPQLPGLES